MIDFKSIPKHARTPFFNKMWNVCHQIHNFQGITGKLEEPEIVSPGRNKKPRDFRVVNYGPCFINKDGKIIRKSAKTIDIKRRGGVTEFYGTRKASIETV